MISLTKRVVSWLLVGSMLLTTPVFAAGESPVFYTTELTQVEESTSVVGSYMAAVSLDLGAKEADLKFGTFYDAMGIDSSDNTLPSSDNEDVVGYRYIPETGETLTVTSPVFPEPVPSKEEPPAVDGALSSIEAASYSVGTTKTIKDKGKKDHLVECVYIGTYCTVWASAQDSSGIRINYAKAKQIADSFDSNYQAARNGFGEGIDIDGDGKLAIFCYDIDKDYGKTEIETYTAGFFRSSDMIPSSGYVGSANFGTEPYQTYGMGLDCIHIDTYPTMGYPSEDALTDVEGCFSTLIHEYQHLINFSHWATNGANGSSMPSYINEAFSMASEHMILDPEATANRIEYFNDPEDYQPGSPLTVWLNNLSNYSNSYLFGQYLRTRYAQQTGTDGNAVFRVIMETWGEHIRDLGSGGSVDELAIIASILNTTKSQLILDFWAAVYLRDDSGPYGFNGESWADAIDPIIRSSPADNSDKIYNGSCIYYELPSGSYTPTTSSNLEFIGFSATGEVELPGAPQLSSIQVERTSASSATITFTSSKDGSLRYEISNDASMDMGGIQGRQSIVKGTNTITLDVGALSEHASTKFWYYTQASDGSRSSVSSVTIPAYSSLILIHQQPGGTVSLTSGGVPVNSGDYVRNGATVTVSVQADPGYTLHTIYVDDNPIDGNTFTVKSDHIVMATFDVAAADRFAGGSGTQADPWCIETVGQLKYFANRVNGGDSMAGEYILLANDIDMTDISFDPIGKSSSTPFAGTFMGGRHTISRLNLEESGVQYVGLFGYNTGTITEVYLDTASIESVYAAEDGCLGSIAAYNSGTVSWCSASGFMYAYGHRLGCIGGIVGDNYGTVSGCADEVQVTVDDNDTVTGDIYAGGIVGYNRANAVVENCSSNGHTNVSYDANVSSMVYVGGIAGYNCGSIRNCLRTNNVEPYGGTTYAGGIVGYLYSGIVENCYYFDPARPITAYGKAGCEAYAGGLAGHVRSGATLTDCVAYAKAVNATAGSSSDEHVGYVAGSAAAGTVLNCHYNNTMTCSGNEQVTSASVSDLLNKAYLTNSVGLDFTQFWDLGNKPSANCPTPQAMRRTQGHQITLNLDGFISVSYAYAGKTMVISIGDETFYVKSLSVDGEVLDTDRFTVTADHLVIVEIGQCVTITTEASENGFISLPAYAPPGRSVSVTATPAAGYVLGGLVVNGETVWGNRFIPTGATTVSGIFVPEGYAGSYGDNLWWVVLDTDSNSTYETLYLTGEGAMAEAANTASIPWLTYSNSLTHAVIGKGITTIGPLCFSNCGNLTQVEIPEGIVSIGHSAFIGCGLTAIDLPDSLVIIEDYAFYSCAALKSVWFGPNLTSIGNNSFNGATSLNAVVISETLEQIGTAAFSGCTRLSDIYYIGTEADRAGLIVDNSNEALQNAQWHYGVTEENIAVIEVAANEQGSITVSAIAAAGESVTVTPAPALGYAFDYLLVNGARVDGTTFTVPSGGTVTVSAVFVPISTQVTTAEDLNAYTFSLYQFDVDQAWAYVVFYDSSDRMIALRPVELGKKTLSTVSVNKSDVPGAASCKVIFTDTDACALDQFFPMDLD